MVLDDLVLSIKTELGFPTISLYIKDEQIKVLIDKAIRRCADKAVTFALVTRPVVNGIVDIADLNASVVKDVYPTTLTSTTDDIFGNGINNAVPMESADYLGVLARVGYQAQAEKMAFRDFYQDGNNLYVDNYEGEVSIEYVKKQPALSDLDSTWLAWVEEYATALVKITEGRIRGKFRPQNAPFEMDYAELVSEGESTKMDLESKLDLAMGYFNILR